MTEATQQQDSFIKQYKGFIAGSIGGIAQVLTGQPFDIVKVRLQASSNPDLTMGKVFTNLVQEEGLRGFYKGTAAPLFMISAQVSVQFGIFERAKQYFLNKSGSSELSTQHLLICSGIAGYGQSFISSPVEYIRIKLQTSTKGKYAGPIDCLKAIYRSRGIAGIYKGLPATQLRDVVGNVFYFAPYNYVLSMTNNPQRGESYLTACQLLAGACAGIACWTTSIPFDVIKSRLQADSISNPKYNGVMQCSKLTFQEFGFLGFFKGIGPCLIRSVFVNAATFGVFEQAKKMVEKYE